MGAPDPLVVVHPDKQSVADGGASRLVTALADAQAVRGEAHVVLTGGSLGSDIIASLVATPGRSAVDWGRVHLWWGDERYLPLGDPDRNDTQNLDAGLGDLGVPAERVHRVPGPGMPGGETLEASATAYAEALASAGFTPADASVTADGSVPAEGLSAGEGGALFDVVLLGVGPDGHVASLFPAHPAAVTRGALTVAVEGSPKPPPQRVSLTRECLGLARQVCFLVAGADKADAVALALAGAPFQRVPAGHVRGRERTVWLVDAEAAAGLADR